MLAAMLRRLGCAVGDLGILADDPIIIADALQQAAAGHAFILASGGVSTGEAGLLGLGVGVENAGKLAFLARRDQAWAAHRHGLNRWRPFHGFARQSRREFRHLRLSGARGRACLSGRGFSEPFTVTPVRAAFTYRKKSRTARVCAS